MAEIEIKKKQPVWPWILLAIIILAVLYFLFAGNDDQTDDVMESTRTETTTTSQKDHQAYNDSIAKYEASDSDIDSYLTYIGDNEKMGMDHEYSNGALTKLIDATKSLGNSLNVDVNADFDSAKEDAASLTEDPYKLDHADKIRDAGRIIVNALKKIQSEKFPDLQANTNEVENALTAIKPATKTLDQKDEVRNFFQKAGDLLTKMKNR